MNGWIKLHRSILESTVFTEPKFLQVWLWCLMRANHKPVKVLIAGRDVDLEAGQFISSHDSAQKQLGEQMTRRKLITSLTYLKTTNRVIISSTPKYSIFTVCNWSDYQSNDQVNDQQAIKWRSTGDQQAITDKNDQELIKNEKNKLYITNLPKTVLSNETSDPIQGKPEDIPQEVWDRVLERLPVPENQHWTQTNAFIMLGRRPMLKYSSIWISPIELSHTFMIFQKHNLPQKYWGGIFRAVQVRADQCILDNKNPEGLPSSSWLTSWALQNALELQNTDLKITRNSASII